MKKLILLLLLVVNIKSFAQFPDTSRNPIPEDLRKNLESKPSETKSLPIYDVINMVITMSNNKPIRLSVIEGKLYYFSERYKDYIRADTATEVFTDTAYGKIKVRGFLGIKWKKKGYIISTGTVYELVQDKQRIRFYTRKGRDVTNRIPSEYR